METSEVEHNSSDESSTVCRAGRYKFILCKIEFESIMIIDAQLVFVIVGQ
jgi:hypothetical protein